MPNREAAIVISDIFVTIVSTLPETFLEAIAFVNEDGFEVARTVHDIFCVYGYFESFLELGFY